MVKYEYAWQKLYVALRCLASAGSIKERLVKAWRSGIYRLVDHLADRNLAVELTAIREALTARTDPDSGKGSVAATVAQMSEDEACGWSMRIVDLAVDITRRSSA